MSFIVPDPSPAHTAPPRQAAAPQPPVVQPPPSPRTVTRANTLVNQAGRRAFNAPGSGSRSQRAATSLVGGGGRRTRRRTLIGGQGRNVTTSPGSA